MSWQPISTAPEGKKVIIFGEVPGMGHARTVIARFWPTHTLEVAEDYAEEDWVEIDEHGTSYMPAGWYEENHVEDGPAVNLKPTHWMPLPAPPTAPCLNCGGPEVDHQSNYYCSEYKPTTTI